MPSSDMSVTKDYNFFDRCLYYIAFGVPGFQKIVGSLEEDIFSSRTEDQKLERPVFVTGLPRSGSTLILELLYSTGEFSSFTYRHMPLITAPILWDRISKPFQQKGRMKERAHNDGVIISYDSPEAFEEVLWLAYLKDKMVGEHVLHLITSDDLETEFIHTFRALLRRIIYLGSESANGISKRYLSKNNANFSRLDAIRKLCPDAVILIPFRSPITHTDSLVRQHERFSSAHSEDTFSSHFMKWIGHYEFGENFKPIDFNGELGRANAKVTPDIPFWLTYWCDSYQHCLDCLEENVYLLDFDALVKNPSRTLAKIADVVDLVNREAFIQKHSSVRQPHSKPISAEHLSGHLQQKTQEIHHQLRAHSINSTA